MVLRRQMGGHSVASLVSLMMSVSYSAGWMAELRWRVGQKAAMMDLRIRLVSQRADWMAELRQMV